MKVTVLFEELLALAVSEAEYDAWLININDSDQFGSGFMDVNPNSKSPTLVDHSGTAPVRMLEFGTILLHLAEKFGKFIPEDPAKRAETLSWLFCQMGSAPILAAGLAISTLMRSRNGNTDQPLRHRSQTPIGRFQPPSRTPCLPLG